MRLLTANARAPGSAAPVKANGMTRRPAKRARARQALSPPASRAPTRAAPRAALGFPAPRR